MRQHLKGIVLDPPYLTTIPARIREAASAVTGAGGFFLLVGGCVRDILLDIEPKDWDCEVFDLEPEKLEEVLVAASLGKVDLVGKAFGVLKLGSDIDIATPRYERKIKAGHRGFEILPDPFMSLEDAALRRDLTINALYIDPLTGILYDPTGSGRVDLTSKSAQPTSERFSEDPLRVLRAAQFISRFGLWSTPDLNRYSKALAPEFNTLSVERLHTEWDKLLGKGKSIAQALQFIDNVNWGKYFWSQRTFNWPSELDTYRDRLGKLDVATSYSLRADRITGRKSDIQFLHTLRTETELCMSDCTEFEAQFRLSSRRVDNISLAKALGVRGNQRQKAKGFEIAHTDGIWRSYHQPKVTGSDLIARGVKPGPEFKHILKEEYRKQMEAMA